MSASLRDILPITTPRSTLFGLTTRNKPAVKVKHGRDEMKEYCSVFSPVGNGGSGIMDSEAIEKDKVRAMREMKSIEEISALDQRWLSAWNQPILAA